jgi:quercetin dioxygenase-like cupin family protein
MVQAAKTGGGLGGLGFAIMALLQLSPWARAMAAEAPAAPDALTVEWQGKHPCERLYEDAQIRVLRCTFPPSAVHLRHSHPGYLTYVLTGGQGQITDAGGERQSTTTADRLIPSKPLAWHEYKNVGNTTTSYLIIEKKYEPVPAVATGGPAK